MKEKCVIGIHQPNFFPWLGYFRKIYESDVFVLLNSVSFTKNSWINRTKLLISGKEIWITCPIKKMPLSTSIMNTEINEEKGKWKKKMLTGIKINYSHCPHYQLVFNVIKNIIETDFDTIGKLNAVAISKICTELEIDTKLRLQSDFISKEVFDTKGSTRLAHLCLEAEGTEYLAGNGADSYENVEVYKKMGITFSKSNFQHPVYKQYNNSADFVPGLSVIDALMNLGFEGTKDLISSV